MTKAGFIRSILNTPTMDPKQIEKHTHKENEPSLMAETSTVDTIHTSYDPLVQSMAIEEQDNDLPTINEIDTEEPIMAMKAQSDPDTMYHHQAMRQPDHDKFTAAMDKEIADQMANGNFILVSKTSVPKGATVLNAVWQMKRKRDIRTGEIIKYKARLNIDDSLMVKGRDYELTYAPVATWNAIRLALTLILLNQWHTVQLDYVLAFPQAPIDTELYMQIPVGMKVPQGNREDYVLQLKHNIYGQK